MAALTEGRAGEAARGIGWLQTLQCADGGWCPQPAVEESTWVTSLVALLPPGQLGVERHRRAIHWLLRLTGRETSTVYRLRQFMLGYSAGEEQGDHGWPWFPGCAAWVSPTAFGILALQREQGRNAAPGLAERIALGRKFLFHRMCADGGWNHGTSKPLGYDCHSYPETTGMALLGLRGIDCPVVSRALDAAERSLVECRSADGMNWLRLGLAAHGRLPANYCPPPVAYRTVRDVAIGVLADAASAGRSLFL